MPEANGEIGDPPATALEANSGHKRLAFRIVEALIAGLLIAALIILGLRFKSQSIQLAKEIQEKESAQLRSAETEQELSRKLTQINELQNDLKTAATHGDELQSQVTDLSREQTRLQTQLESSQKYQKSLEDRLVEEEATVAELQKKLDEESGNLKIAFSKIEKLMEERESLKEKVAKLQPAAGSASTVTMPELVVSQKPPPLTPLEGKILAVNRHYNFVVINLGEKDGVQSGNRFSVSDDGKKMGEVIARRVLPAMTVADINPDRTPGRLKKNFTVALHEE